MSARNDLAKLIWTTSRNGEGTTSATSANHIADAIQAAGYRKPRIIEPGPNQGAELNALPVGVVLRPVARHAGAVEKANDGDWWSTNWVGASPTPLLAQLDLPWIVLYNPEDAT